MIAAVALTITGSLDIYSNGGHAKSSSWTQWKVGTILIAIAWGYQMFWSLFSLLPGRGRKDAPGYHGGTAVRFSQEPTSSYVYLVADHRFFFSPQLIQGAFIALLFLGVRVIYGIVYVVTQRRDLSPIYGSLAVRVLLMFLPEVFAALTMVVVGVRTRHLRQPKLGR